MAAIRGPKSALTDFIEEHGIKIVAQGKKPSTATKKAVQTKRRVRKKERLVKPLEIANLDAYMPTLSEIALKKLFSFFHTGLVMDDIQLELFSEFLSKKRLMDQRYFNYLVDKSTSSLVIYDCSAIQDSGFAIEKSYKRIELHLCGQLTSSRINSILKHSPGIEVLRITGGFMIRGFEIPVSLKTLDVSYCSRIEDDFVENINKKFTYLDELRLSHCRRLSEQCMLKAEVSRVYVCGTRLSNSFFLSMRNICKIKHLSAPRCINIKLSELPWLEQIEFLDLEEATDVNKARISETCRSLSLESCTDVSVLPRLGNLFSLNLSRVNLRKRELRKLLKMKNLREVNLGWNDAVDDSFVLELTKQLSLERIYVFGCFKLTPRIGKLAWSLSNRLRIIGNPAETAFLLNN